MDRPADWGALLCLSRQACILLNDSILAVISVEKNNIGRHTINIRNCFHLGITFSVSSHGAQKDLNIISYSLVSSRFCFQASNFPSLNCILKATHHGPSE